MKYTRCWLADYPIDLSFADELEHLAESFAHSSHQPSYQNPAPSLKLSFSVDRSLAQRVGSVGEMRPYHRRFQQGQHETHVWFTNKPLRLEKLSLDLLSGHAVGSVHLGHHDQPDGGFCARPGNDIISTWAVTRGLLPVHASGIAINARALLLLGEGGSGKTTTALALADKGWDLLGDDVCFVCYQQNQIKVFSLYSTSVITQESQMRLQVQHWKGLGVTHHAKHARGLPPSLRVTSEADLVGAVWVVPDAKNRVTLQSLRRHQAIVPWQQAFAPALQAHGPSANLLKHLAACCRLVPTYHLKLAWDFGQIDHALREVLHGEFFAP